MTGADSPLRTLPVLRRVYDCFFFHLCLLLYPSSLYIYMFQFPEGKGNGLDLCSMTSCFDWYHGWRRLKNRFLFRNEWCGCGMKLGKDIKRGPRLEIERLSWVVQYIFNSPYFFGRIASMTPFEFVSIWWRRRWACCFLGHDTFLKSGYIVNVCKEKLPIVELVCLMLYCRVRDMAEGFFFTSACDKGSQQCSRKSYNDCDATLGWAEDSFMLWPQGKEVYRIVGYAYFALALNV